MSNVIGLPSHEEASRKVEEGRATALEIFVHEYEPSGGPAEDKFRSQLRAVLSEAEGRFHVSALYARLRGVCPYCGGADVEVERTGERAHGRQGERIRLPVECEDCGAKWFDVYDLFRVETRGQGITNPE